MSVIVTQGKGTQKPRDQKPKKTTTAKKEK